MKQQNMQVLKNISIAAGVFACTLKGDLVKDVINPGQFLQIQIAGTYLRRPISISTFDSINNELVIVYKVLGKGTELLSKVTAGCELNCLGPLGNGFDLRDFTSNEETIIITGGGIGVPPLLGLATVLKHAHPQKQIISILGFRSQEDVFFEAEFSLLGQCIITTDDGSYQNAGNVMTQIKRLATFNYIFACGPEGLLAALESNFSTVDMQLSYEERMACGVGICMGCVRFQANEKGYIRLCKEGPVVKHEKILKGAQL
ncbi:MAG: dihydroorotate dehydrogenase electron transfer subunit [Culicoidibacterales bacterium]